MTTLQAEEAQRMAARKEEELEGEETAKEFRRQEIPLLGHRPSRTFALFLFCSR